MSPQDQWEALKDLGPIGSVLAALVSVLNLAVVAWWKTQRNEVETTCNAAQKASQDAAIKDVYTRIRDEAAQQDSKRDKAAAAMRDYTDEERHNLREWMQGQVLVVDGRFHQQDERIKQLEQDNRECATDRRNLAVSLSERK